MNYFALVSPSLLPVHLPLLALSQSGKPGQSSCGKKKKKERKRIQSTHLSVSSGQAHSPSQDRNIDKMSASHLIILPRVAVGKIAHAGGSSGGSDGGVYAPPCVCSAGRKKPMFVKLATPTPCCCSAELSVLCHHLWY